ncbi:MAG: hypothetical protein JWM11_2417 [Planctomycetaceae bacterium]|nr:hypothetical protein [Planctomycetaceae bacterium]
MWNRKRLGFVTSTAIAISMVGVAGCHKCMRRCDYMGDITPYPIGTISDPIWQKQEHNAEASDFVVHEHEFTANTARLNAAGEQHVKQIALRFSQKPDMPYPVMIEPSSMSARPGDKYGFQVHNDPSLDLNRRQVIVAALQAMGLQDAEQKVVVSPALTPGFQEFEASRAYGRGFGNMGGMGGGGMGGGGMGGGGGGGGGFF